MRLVVTCALLSGLACGRDQGVADDQLQGLVVEAKPPAKIDVDQAAKDPAELDRAMATSYSAVVTAIGAHAVTIATKSAVAENGKPTDELSDKATLELGDAGAFRGVYTNSADYGREAVFLPPGQLYLRPRYQRWHGRAPETAAEPAQIRDAYFGAIAATWELLAPGAELTDKGPVQVAGRAGRKIAVKLAPSPRENPREPLSQRRWRESRTVSAVDGDVTLDAETGVPLAADLRGAVAFSRDGRRFTMTVGLTAVITKFGATTITAPPENEVIATPNRRGEVDERDYLLHGIAPPIRKNADGTAAKPMPATATTPAMGSGSGTK
jgi:hypothetical protein